MSKTTILIGSIHDIWPLQTCTLYQQRDKPRWSFNISNENLSVWKVWVRSPTCNVMQVMCKQHIKALHVCLNYQRLYSKVS